MADNVAITAGSGTTIAADDIGGVKHQRVKISIGADGTAADWPVGSGNQSAVPRITLATDSPGVVTLGQAAMAASTPVVIASNQSAVPTTITDISSGEYETVAASQTAQVLGATGGTGDYISGLLVIPATTSPGLVTLLDNATSIPVFVGGASSVSNLVPFFIPLGIKSVSGAWKVTTGANVSVIGSGNFT